MFIAGVNVAQSFDKTVWQFLVELNTDSPYNPATPVLGIYQVN